MLKNLRRHWPHLLASFSGIEMLIKFWQLPSPDYQGMGIGISVIIGALAGKSFIDQRMDRPQPNIPPEA
jgi:hypothetical protein